MPAKSGQPEFGPPPSKEVTWIITLITGKKIQAQGQTAFYAAQSVNLQLSECERVERVSA